MTHPRILPGGALAAAELYTARLGTRRPLSMAAAGDLHDVTRQAVSDALRDPRRYAREVPAGRRPRAGAAARRQVTIRFPAFELRNAWGVSVRLTDAELAAWQRAAGEQSLQDWVRSLPGIAAGAGGAEVRRVANAAALIPM
jgi:hypothetical protein